MNRKQNNFKVPEGYFNDVQLEILQKTTHVNNKKNNRRFVYKIAATACVLFLFVGGFWFLNSTQQSNEENLALAETNQILYNTFFVEEETFENESVLEEYAQILDGQSSQTSNAEFSNDWNDSLEYDLSID